MTQSLCEEAGILKSELLDGESCRLSCDGRGFFYYIICLSRVGDNLPSHREEIKVTDLDADDEVKRETNCKDEETLMTEERERQDVEKARHSLCPSPPAELSTSPPSSSSESAEESAPASSSETESSLDPAEAEAEYQPVDEVPPKLRRRQTERFRKRKASAKSLDSNAEEADCEIECAASRRCRGQNLYRRKRRCTERKVERYGAFRNWKEVERP